MFSSSSTLRRPTAALAALMLSLAIAPAALAGTLPPDRSDALGGSHQTSHVSTVTPPDRADGLGGAAVASHTAVQGAPDRIDGLGGSNFTPVATPTVIIRSSPAVGFDWTAAVLGAVAGLGIALVAMAALLSRGRRDVALPS